MTPAIVTAVAAILTQSGILARVESMGGGGVNVVVEEAGGRQWVAGTVNETWGLDLVDCDDACNIVDAMQTTVPSTSTEPETIAAGLYTVISEWRADLAEVAS